MKSVQIAIDMPEKTITSGGLGDSVAKTLKKFGVTGLVEAVTIYMGGVPCNKAEQPEMSKCALKTALLNELFPYKITRKVRFLKAWKKRENVSHGTPPVYEVVFSANVGDEVVIDRMHPACNLLLWLGENKTVEEID